MTYAVPNLHPGNVHTPNEGDVVGGETWPSLCLALAFVKHVSRGMELSIVPMVQRVVMPALLRPT